MESKASSTSNLVIHRPEALLSCSERASAAVSSQPVRRGRRVTDPNSWPVRARAAPACAQRAGLLASYNSLGKRAAAHARAIRFGDAQNVMQLPRPDARARCSRASHAMAAGHKGISAMIDIEQRALRALKQ